MGNKRRTEALIAENGLGQRDAGVPAPSPPSSSAWPLSPTSRT